MLTVRNAGWAFSEMSDEAFAKAAEEDAIRGFRLTKHATRHIKVEAGQHIVLDGKGGHKGGLSVETGKPRTRKAKAPEHGFTHPLKNATKEQETEGGYVDPNMIEVEKVSSGGCTGCVVQ
mmetsp:Transcript_50934/g.132341  ORF Transcript_50934/g.132341 Transcript_50934/m.132341 type:complete len:120 (+) Transcript_50934:56-415(+)